jgi:hypothetical protein
MSEQNGGFHLPSPSSQPIITSLGIALSLVGLIPSATVWRLALISLGSMIFLIGVWLWISDAAEEYRNLPD